MRWREWTEDELRSIEHRAVIDELNTLSLPSCVLLKSFEELTDGVIFLEMFHAALRSQKLGQSGHTLRQGRDVPLRGGGEDGARQRIHAVLAGCRQLVPAWPQSLLHPDCVHRVTSGERSATAALAQLLCRCVDGRVRLRAERRPPTTVHPPLMHRHGSGAEEVILSWLRDLLRPQPSARNTKRIELSSPSSVPPAFSSGVVLCLVVER